MVEPNTQRGLGKYADKWLTYFLSREVINCNDETFRVESKDAYFDDGSNLSAPAESFPTLWKPIAPETRAAAEMKIVCGPKP
jgi:hypothetical protein